MGESRRNRGERFQNQAEPSPKPTTRLDRTPPTIDAQGLESIEESADVWHVGTSDEAAAGKRTVGKETGGGRFRKGLLRLLRFVLRLLFVVLLGIALGVGLYFGGVVLYNRYVVPVQVHSIQISQLETREVESHVAATRAMNDLHERLDTVQQQGTEGIEAAAALETRVAAVVAAQEALALSLDELQADLASAQAAQEATEAELEGLKAAGEPLQEDLEVVQTAQEEVRSTLETVQSEQAALLSDVETLQDEVAALETAEAEAADRTIPLESGALDPEALAALRRDLAVVKAMELLTRARMLLLQSNYGLVQNNVRSARDLLVALQAEAPAGEAQALESIVERLDAALDNLPGVPVAAADEMDGAWQLLAAGLPSGDAGEPTAPGTATVTVTATATPRATTTPRATATSRATATPTPSS